MLDFYQSYRLRDLPDKLKGELIDVEDSELTKLEHLSKVNIFVGANNSGKSRIIREVLRSKSAKYYGDDEWSQIEKLVQFLKSFADKAQMN
jgi:hypothetical protein